MKVGLKLVVSLAGKKKKKKLVVSKKLITFNYDLKLV